MATNVTLRDRLARPSTRIALVLVAVGVLFVLVWAQSPSRLYWTGDAVTGTNHEGIVFYRVHGEQFTVDDPGPVPAHDTRVTVYVDPQDPTRALLERPVRWVDAGTVLACFVAAAAVLVLAALRRARRRRRSLHPAPGEGYGEGLDADWVARYRETQLRPPHRTPSP